MTLKNIKVTENVKDKLDSIAYEKETYNLTIQRLIYENEQLRKDKEMLMKIAMKTEDSIAFPTATHSTIFSTMEVLKDTSYTDDEKFDFLKIYLRPNLEKNPLEVRDTLSSFEEDYGVSSFVINRLITWINIQFLS